jgi:Tol biopolymer transport system component
MCRLPLAVVLLAFPVGAAAAQGGQQALLLATNTDVLVAAADGSGQQSLTGGRLGNVRDIAWSPDGSIIAFSGIARDGRSLWAVRADGANLRRLAASTSDDLLSPTFSPDGSELAYIEEPSSNGPGDVWVVATAGGPANRLTSDGGAKTAVAWSPAGGRLLIVTAGSPSTISTLDLARGTASKLTDGVAAAWSPDGKRVAFLDPQFRLLVMSADGSGAREVAPRADSPPAWSVDGSTILFDRVTPIGPATKFGLPTRTDVFSVPSDGSFPPRQLTGPRVRLPAMLVADDGRRPSLSADGSQIYYQRYQPQTAGNDGWRMNSDGTCPQPVPSLTRVALGPVWRAGVGFGPPVRCVDLRVYAVPQAEYFPIVGRAAAIVVVENDGNEPAGNLRFSVTAAGGGARNARCIPSCSVALLDPGATGSIVVDAATSSPGPVNVSVTVTADQQSVDAGGTTSRVALTVLDCTLVGTDGPDRLTGTPRADRICGKPGLDWMSGGAGDDYLDAGSGDDTAIGGPGHDTILGRGGRDTIFARDGQRDPIDCGTERDVAVVDRFDHVHGCERVLRRRATASQSTTPRFGLAVITATKHR